MDSQAAQRALDSEASEFLIGRDQKGHWLAVEKHGLAGGFFCSAADAMRFANSGVRATRIVFVDTIEDPFDCTCAAIASKCKRDPDQG